MGRSVKKDGGFRLMEQEKSVREELCCEEESRKRLEEVVQV